MLLNFSMEVGDRNLALDLRKFEITAKRNIDVYEAISFSHISLLPGSGRDIG